MLNNAVSRIAIASAVVAVAGGVLAIPAVAQAGAVGPKQYFDGEVFGVTSSNAQDVIEVACAAAASTGHPVAGQSVAVHQIYPPTTTSPGYTGDFGTEIDTSLLYSRGTISVLIPIATFASYDDPAPIPTSITVPCSGSGVMRFNPYPDPDGTGRSSEVDITFVSIGV
jgi:predicted RecA/RadA family phage recombinase